MIKKIIFMLLSWDAYIHCIIGSFLTCIIFLLAVCSSSLWECIGITSFECWKKGHLNKPLAYFQLLKFNLSFEWFRAFMTILFIKEIIITVTAFRIKKFKDYLSELSLATHWLEFINSLWLNRIYFSSDM